MKGLNGGLQSIDMSQQHHVVAHNMYNPYLWKHYVMDPVCYMAAAIGEPNAAMLRVHPMSCKECPECMIPVYDAVTKQHCFCNILNRAAMRLCTTTNGDGADNVFLAVLTQKVDIGTTAINNIPVKRDMLSMKSHMTILITSNMLTGGYFGTTRVVTPTGAGPMSGTARVMTRTGRAQCEERRLQ